MQFKISTNKEELIKLAESTEFETYNNIETPGAYSVIIDTAELVSGSEKTKFFEIKFTTDDENKQNGKVRLLVQTKAGKSTYTKNGTEYDLSGVNMIRGSLMILTKTESLDTTTVNGKDGSTHLIYKMLQGKKVGMLLDIKKSPNKKKPGEFFFNQELVGFYDIATNKTAGELMRDEPAVAKAQKEAKCKLIDETVLMPVKSDNPFEEEVTKSDTNIKTTTEQDKDFWVE